MLQVETVVRECLLPSLSPQPVGFEALRVYYLLVELLQVPQLHQLSMGVADALLCLHPDRLEVLGNRQKKLFKNQQKSLQCVLQSC